MAPVRSIGLMSGTSGDGVDAILLQLQDVDRPHRPEVLARSSLSFSSQLQAELVRPDDIRVSRLAQLHFLLPQHYADAVRQMTGWQDADCVGMHGQTVAHLPRPEAVGQRATLQIGSSAVLAAELGLPVVGDMRAVDVALGGQGAPLVPFCHWFFLAGENRSTLVVNLGGICNLTLVTPKAASVVGYDVGPGMMLSDAHAVRHSAGALACDLDGALSAGGRRLPRLLEAVLAHPFLARPPPKSAGREEFGAAFAESLWAHHVQGASAADVAFTLVEASVTALWRAVEADSRLRGQFSRLLLAGGGARNPTLRRCAERAFADVEVAVEADGVLAPHNHEPAAMALIAARTLHGLPSSLAQVTGASAAAVLGHVHAPPQGLAARPGPVAARSVATP